MPDLRFPDALAAVRCNRHELRRRGLTSADLAQLELMLARPRLPLAAIGRILGYSRSAAWHRARRLEALGAVLRLGARLLPNVRGLLRWAREGVAERRRAASRARPRPWEFLRHRRKTLKTHAESESVEHGSTHTGPRLSSTRAPSPETHSPAAVEAFWLRKMGLQP